MPLDPRAKRFLDMIAAGSGSEPSDVEAERAAFRLLMQNAGTEPAAVGTRDILVPGGAGLLPARLYDPSNQGIRPGLVFFHGGGLVAGDLDTHDGICSQLAAAADCRVVSVGYRLAPEHPFPAAVEDAVTATAALSQMAATMGIDGRRLAVGGDSVGAILAVVACQEATRRRGPGIRAQLLICPILDARRDSESHRLFAEGHFLRGDTFDRQMEAYGGAALDRDDPRISPGRTGDVSGMPPAIIHTAEFDPVRDDGAAYAERLSEAGVPVRYTCHPGMIHLFYGLGRVIPQGRAALQTIGASLAASLAPDPDALEWPGLA